MRKVRGLSDQQHKNLSLCHITCVCVVFLDNPQVVVVLMQIGGNLGRGQKWGRYNHNQHSWPSTVPSKLTPPEHL